MTSANAETPGWLELSAFGTIGLAWTDERQADYRDGWFQPRGVGYTDRISPRVDSRLGVQAAVTTNSRWSGVIQLVAEQRYVQSYRPQVEWANIRYQASPNLSLRLGRTRLPTFLVSDFRKVGYAQHWVRPPAEVYSLMPVTSIDGIDLSWRFPHGTSSTTLQAVYGRDQIRLGETFGRWKSSHLAGAFLTTEWSDFTLRGGHQTGRVTAVELSEFYELYRWFGQPGMAIEDRYSLDGRRVKLWTVGAEYEPGDWFVRGEWARSSSRSFLGTSSGWYATSGKRFGAWTPYVVFGQRSRASSTQDADMISAADVPPEWQNLGDWQLLADYMNLVLRESLRDGSFSTLSLGARWDWTANASLKLQWDHLRLGSESAAELTMIQPDFRFGGRLNVISLTLDVVYW